MENRDLPYFSDEPIAAALNAINALGQLIYNCDKDNWDTEHQFYTLEDDEVACIGRVISEVSAFTLRAYETESQRRLESFEKYKAASTTGGQQ